MPLPPPLSSASHGQGHGHGHSHGHGHGHGHGPPPPPPSSSTSSSTSQLPQHHQQQQSPYSTYAPQLPITPGTATSYPPEYGAYTGHGHAHSHGQGAPPSAPTTHHHSQQQHAPQTQHAQASGTARSMPMYGAPLPTPSTSAAPATTSTNTWAPLPPLPLPPQPQATASPAVGFPVSLAGGYGGSAGYPLSGSAGSGAPGPNAGVLSPVHGESASPGAVDIRPILGSTSAGAGQGQGQAPGPGSAGVLAPMGSELDMDPEMEMEGGNGYDWGRERERGKGRGRGMEDPRSTYVPKIQDHCLALYHFASKYAQPSPGTAPIQPSSEDLAEMQQRAEEVVEMLRVLRELTLDDNAADNTMGKQHPDDPLPTTRAPKRPWEDVSGAEDEDIYPGPGYGMVQGVGGQPPLPSSLPPPPPSVSFAPIPGSERAQTAAEEDMALIRRKRATTTGTSAGSGPAGAAGGLAGGMGGPGTPSKGKYRKRSRATPPGKCHSCNIRETPEWRRGPDGARTLCNACGLHYAKMLKKRDKQPTGEQIEIDMDTLRASTRAAAEREQRKAERERERERDRQNAGASGSMGTIQKSGTSEPGTSSAGLNNMPSSAGSGPNISPRSAHSQASGSYTTEVNAGTAYSVEPGQMLPPLSMPQGMQNPHPHQQQQQQQYYPDSEGHHGYPTRVTGPPGSGLLHIRTASTS